MSSRGARTVARRAQGAGLVLEFHRERVLAHAEHAPPVSWALSSHVDRGRSRGDHRIAVLARVAARVDHGRAPERERGGERRLEVVVVVDGEAGAAVRLGELRESGT